MFEAFWSDDPAHALMHGPTYMANALACAAANASLDLFEREPRLAQVAAISAALARGLAPCRDMPGVKDVRVKGAIGVVELERIDDLDGAARAFRRARACSSGRSAHRLSDAGFTIDADDLHAIGRCGVEAGASELTARRRARRIHGALADRSGHDGGQRD